MANTGPSSASDDGAKAYHPVFIDTNLDTHFALLAAESDTVFDLKQKIILEHPQCFPRIGKVEVHAIQVKRKEFFYHLPDSMFVQTAFGGAKKGWLIYVHLGKPDDCNNRLALPWVTDRPSNSRHDTPCGKSVKRFSLHHYSSSLQPGHGVPSFDQVSQGGSFGASPKYIGAGELYIRDGHCKTVYADYNKRSDLEEKYDVVRKRMASKKRTRDLQHDSSLEGASESRPAAKKKRKTGRNESSRKIFKKDEVVISKANNVTSKGPCSTLSNIVREPESGIVKGNNVAPLLVVDYDVREKSGSSKYEAAEKKVFPAENDNEKLIKESENVSGCKRKTVSENRYAARNEDESVAKHADIVPSAQENEEMLLSYTGKKETSERELIQKSHRYAGRNVENLIRGEADIMQATEANRSQDGEDVKEKSKECENTGRSRKEKKKKKKKATKLAERDVDASIVEHANDMMIDTTSTVPKPSSDGHLIQKQEKDKSTLFDTERKDIPVEESQSPTVHIENLTGDGADILQATEANRNQEHGEDVTEKSMVCEHNGKKKKKKIRKVAERDEDASVVDHANDVIIDTASTVPKSSSDGKLNQKQDRELSTLFDTGRKETPVEKLMNASQEVADREISEKRSIEESHGPAGREIETNLIAEEADILQATEANRNQEHGEDVKEKSMVCEHIGKKKKKKTWKGAARDEDASVVDHANDVMIDTTSTVLKPSSDGHLNQKQEKEPSTLFDTERKEMPVEKLIDASHEVADREISEEKSIESHWPAGRDIEKNLIRDEANILQATEANGSQEHGEDVEEKSMVCESIGQSKKKKKMARKIAATDEDASVVDYANDKSTLFDTVRKEIPAEKSMNASHAVSGSEAKGRQEKGDGNDQVGVSEYGVGTIGSAKHAVDEKECETTGETRRKNRKKVKKSSAIHEVTSVVELATDAGFASTVPNLAPAGHLIEKLEKDNSILCHTTRTGRREEKSADNSHTVDRKRDGVTGSEAVLGEPKIGQGDVNEKSSTRGKGKKSKNSTKSFHGFPTDEHDLDVVHSQLNQVEKTKENAPITDHGLDKKTKQKQRSVKVHSDLPGKDEEVGLQPQRSHDTEHVSFLPEKTSKDICMFEVLPSLVLDNVVEANTDDQVDVLNHDCEGIDFKRYFISDQQQNGYSLSNQVNDEKQLARLNQAKNTTRHVVPSKISQEVSGDEMKAPNSHHIDHIKTPQKARQPAILTVSKANRSPPVPNGNNGLLVGSSSGSESSVRSRRKTVNNIGELRLGQSGAEAVGKSASKSTGAVVNVSRHGKSLLATPGAIFGDDSSNSSADDNGNVNSDASTRTPSDKSLSSESEGESESTMDSGRKGSYAAKRKSGRKYLVDSQSSDMKNKTIEEILRSSSRFKKAKLVASQLLKDTDSEAVEFVPDSQANS